MTMNESVDDEALVIQSTVDSINLLDYQLTPATALTTIHHHHNVACPVMDAVTPTSVLHACRFCARR